MESNMNWDPESLGLTRNQNYMLWKDMERAYDYIEDHAPYSISGDINGFLFELIRRRWNIACNDIVEDPPIIEAHTSTKYPKKEIVPDIKIGISQVGVGDIPLSDAFKNRFVQFAKETTQADKAKTQGKLYGYGTDGFGTYLPLHLLWPELVNYWGIYISETGVLQLAARMYNLPNLKWEENIQTLIQIAYQAILRHELFHFKIEQWALIFELATGKPYYLPYLAYVYLPTIYDDNDNNLEEALANTSILLSTKIKALAKKIDVDINRGLQDVFLIGQGPNYRNYGLKRGVPFRFGEFQYRNVVNYLCNQIIQTDIRPTVSLVPYYLFPPNNNFLRAENLCPIYLVRHIPLEASVIGSV